MDEYDFNTKGVDNISAYQYTLDDHIGREKQIREFFQLLKLDFNHLYLLIYEGHSISYNRITERKKLWGHYPNLELSDIGDTYVYKFPSGIVFASYAHLNSDSINSGIELLTSHHLQSVIVNCPKHPLDSECIRNFFDETFADYYQKNIDPSIIHIDYNKCISQFCNLENGVVRYGTDGCSSEVCYFSKGGKDLLF